MNKWYDLTYCSIHFSWIVFIWHMRHQTTCLNFKINLNVQTAKPKQTQFVLFRAWCGMLLMLKGSSDHSIHFENATHRTYYYSSFNKNLIKNCTVRDINTVEDFMCTVICLTSCYFKPAHETAEQGQDSSWKTSIVQACVCPAVLGIYEMTFTVLVWNVF